jgi:hypothetical protein
MKVIRAKARRPSALGYNSLIAIPFDTVNMAGASNVNAAAIIPLGLNVKIQAVSLGYSAAGAGSNVTMNIVSGVGAYETGGTAASNVLWITGSDDGAARTYTVTIGGNAVVYSAAMNASTVTIMTGIAAAITANGPASALVTAVYSNVNGHDLVTITDKTPGTAGNAVTVTTATTSTGYILYVSPTQLFSSPYPLADTLHGGANGVAPVLAPGDNTYLGVAPITVAATGNVLFAADQVMTPVANGVQVFYAVDGFDSAFGSDTLLTLRLNDAGGNAAGTVKAILWCVPIDRFPYNPQDTSSLFVPGPTTL